MTKSLLKSDFKILRLLAAVSAGAALILTVSLSSHAARFGREVSSGEYQNVVFIMGGAYNGSGVLIAPDVVLTVSHNIAGVHHRAIRVHRDASVAAIRNPRKVVDVQVYSEDYREELALLKLDRPIYSLETNLKTDLEFTLPRSGSQVFGVGFGVTTNPIDDINSPKKREAEMSLYGLRYVYFDKVESTNQADAETVEMIEMRPSLDKPASCVGDSGGGLFANDADTGKLRLVGILGHVFTDESMDISTKTSECAAVNVVRAIPVANYVDWIRNVFNEWRSAKETPANLFLCAQHLKTERSH